MTLRSLLLKSWVLDHPRPSKLQTLMLRDQEISFRISILERITMASSNWRMVRLHPTANPKNLAQNIGRPNPRRRRQQQSTKTIQLLHLWQLRKPPLSRRSSPLNANEK